MTYAKAPGNHTRCFSNRCFTNASSSAQNLAWTAGLLESCSKGSPCRSSISIIGELVGKSEPWVALNYQPSLPQDPQIVTRPITIREALLWSVRAPHTVLPALAATRSVA